MWQKILFYFQIAHKIPFCRANKNYESREIYESSSSRLFADGRNRDLSFSLASAGCDRVDIGSPRKSPASTRVPFGLLHLAVLFHYFVIPFGHPFRYPNLSNSRMAEKNLAILPILRDKFNYAQIIVI